MEKDLNGIINSWPEVGSFERDSHMHLVPLQANNTLSIHCVTRAFSEGLTLAHLIDQFG